VTPFPGLPPKAVSGALSRFGPVESKGPFSHRAAVPPVSLRDALKVALSKLALDHMVQLATIDRGEAFELRYIMTGPHRALVTLTTTVPRTLGGLPSVHDLLPPAALYERQIHDLFGIEFTGHPGLKRLMLADDWPPGVFPLRRDFTVEGTPRRTKEAR
jgi:NADH:ubiquinone oxidoreductase subunit C